MDIFDFFNTKGIFKSMPSSNVLNQNTNSWGGVGNIPYGPVKKTNGNTMNLVFLGAGAFILFSLFRRK